MGKTDKGICDECGSVFLRAASKMEGLCPECAAMLYGYKNCKHTFKESYAIFTWF